MRAFALYGETTGETDECGLPVRYPWAQGYRGKAVVLYGHTPVPTVEWINNTACLDTGCLFGGALADHAEDAGTVAGLIGAVGFGTAGILAPVLTMLPHAGIGYRIALAIVIAVVAVCSAAITLVVQRGADPLP